MARNITFENARITFRNFSGKGSQFNREGDKNFCIVIDNEAMADELRADGWNIKQFRATEENPNPDYYLPVAVAFRSEYPPIVNIIKGKTMTQLDDETVYMLDHARIATCDICIRPYTWDVNGKTGVKAYLEEMYVTLETSQLSEKYANYASGSDWDTTDDEDELPF